MAFHGLNLSDAKLANIKSPVFLRLETMISTLDRFRSEMDGNRIPKYEMAFLEKKQKELEKQKRIRERQERKEKVKMLQELNPKAVQEYSNVTGTTPRMITANEHKFMNSKQNV